MLEKNMILCLYNIIIRQEYFSSTENDSNFLSPFDSEKTNIVL